MTTAQEAFEKWHKENKAPTYSTMHVFLAGYASRDDEVAELKAEGKQVIEEELAKVEAEAMNLVNTAITALKAENAELRRQLEAKQAEIDRLMMEFCPEEMTPEQKVEWAKHQVPDDPMERECCGTFFRSPHRSTCPKYRGKFKAAKKEK